MTTFTISDITCTLFIPSHALYMTTQLLCMRSHSLYVLHHTSVSTYSSIDDINTSVYVITLDTRMTSYPIYIPSHSHYMT